MKMVLSNLGELRYFTAFFSPNKDAIMERRQRAFIKNDAQFKELFGVKKSFTKCTPS